MDKKMFARPYVYVIGAAYILISYMVLGWGDKVLAFAVPEDHFFEAVGALSFFIASILFFVNFIKFNVSEDEKKTYLIKRLIYLGLALMFLFGAGEEISWGQRIFEFDTPASIVEVNRQDEFNIHNLGIRGEKIPFSTMFDLFWGSFAFALPLLAFFVKPFWDLVVRFVPISHWGISLLFLFNYLWAKVAKLIYVSKYHFDFLPFQQAVTEIKEANYAILFLLVALFLYLDEKNKPDKAFRKAAL